MTTGIELDIQSQFYRDYPKVRAMEQSKRSSQIWTPVNPLALGVDSDFAAWKPGDTVADKDAILENQSTPLYTITSIHGEKIFFRGVTGKNCNTHQTNLLRLQERKA